MSPEEIYVSLGRLAANPAKLYTRRIGQDAQLWLGRLYACTLELRLVVEAAQLSVLTTKLTGQGDANLEQQVFAIMYRALAVAEARAPSAVSGMFINAGNSFDAMTAVGKVLTSATSSIRIVDPYMDEKALTDFAILANEGVRIEILADASSMKASLEPACRRFVDQYLDLRPLELRVSPPRSLHDRLIVVDGTEVWALTQSLKDFAARSPASIVRIDGEASILKIAAYDEYWEVGEKRAP